MTDKEIAKLRRTELLEILYSMRKEMDSLAEENQSLKNELENQKNLVELCKEILEVARDTNSAVKGETSEKTENSNDEQ